MQYALGTEITFCKQKKKRKTLRPTVTITQMRCVRLPQTQRTETNSIFLHIIRRNMLEMDDDTMYGSSLDVYVYALCVILLLVKQQHSAHSE